MSGRKVSDCRKTPSVSNCSLTIAGTEEEVVRAAVEHMVSAHGHTDSPALREEVRASLEDEEGYLPPPWPPPSQAEAPGR